MAPTVTSIRPLPLQVARPPVSPLRPLLSCPAHLYIIAGNSHPHRSRSHSSSEFEPASAPESAPELSELEPTPALSPEGPTQPGALPATPTSAALTTTSTTTTEGMAPPAAAAPTTTTTTTATTTTTTPAIPTATTTPTAATSIIPEGSLLASATLLLAPPELCGELQALQQSMMEHALWDLHRSCSAATNAADVTSGVPRVAAAATADAFDADANVSPTSAAAAAANDGLFAGASTSSPSLRCKVWREHMQPLVADVALLLDTASEVNARLYCAPNAPLPNTHYIGGHPMCLSAVCVVNVVCLSTTNGICSHSQKC